MKLTATLITIGALAGAPAFAAERIAIEAGSGNHWSKGANSVFVRYSGDHTIPNFPQQPAFYEWSLGMWDGEHENSALGLSLGTQWFVAKFHFDVSAGVAYAANKTRLSSTRQQFILRYGGGYSLGKIDLGIYQTHYSNGQDFFDWDGYNVGYDFLTFQIGYAFR